MGLAELTRDATESLAAPGFASIVAALMANPKLPRGAIQQLGALHLRHAGGAHAIAWSPRGDLIASIGFDEALMLWNASTGALVHRLSVQDAFVRALAFSPDGTRVASGKKAVRVWDTATGKVALTIKGHKHTVNALDFSPDGATVATASDDQTVRFFDASTGAERSHLWFGDQAMDVRFSPDGRHVLVASEHAAMLHAVTGELVAKVPVRGWRDFFRSAFSPDGTEVFIAPHDGDELLRLKVPSLETIATIKLDHGLRAVDVSRDGRWLAFGGFGRYSKTPHPHQVANRDVYCTHVYLWDVAAWKQVALLQGNLELVQGVAFSPDSKRVASSSGDNTVRAWTVPDGKPALVPGPGFESEPVCCAFLSDGRAAVAAYTATTIWSAREGAVLAEAPDAGHLQLIPHGDRELFALHARRPERWTLDGAQLTRAWRAPDTDRQLYVMRASPDHARLFIGDERGMLHCWRVGEDAPEWSKQILEGAALTALAVSPDGQWVAAGGTHKRTWHLIRADGTGEARALSIPDRGEVQSYRDYLLQVVSLTFSPDSARVYACTIGGNVEVYSTASGDHVQRIATLSAATGASYPTQAGDNLALSPDGAWIATSYRSLNDARLMIFSTADGSLRVAVSGHAGPIDALAVSADGAQLLTVHGRAREVFVWDVKKLLAKK